MLLYGPAARSRPISRYLSLSAAQLYGSRVVLVGMWSKCLVLLAAEPASAIAISSAGRWSARAAAVQGFVVIFDLWCALPHAYTPVLWLFSGTDCGVVQISPSLLRVCEVWVVFVCFVQLFLCGIKLLPAF